MASVYNVYTKEIQQTGGEIFVVSVLELCESSLLDYDKEYSCRASSKVDQERDESTFTLNPFGETCICHTMNQALIISQEANNMHWYVHVKVFLLPIVIRSFL